ncbi:MAG TPA: PAS domain-containing sensor histidine kinase [Desulfobacteraceae bacterium]|nr:PAS domain-containing sensor histidine kinase [Desulfobacteraceae bacterium]
MIYKKFKKINCQNLNSDSSKRKREWILIIVIIFIVTGLTFIENKVVPFGAGLPVEGAILMFILVNINLLLLILMIFLVFRNLVKLFYDRKRKATGAKLRTKLVIAFVSLTLLPTIILFFFSINFITNSIDFWFNVPVEQALENSLQIGRNFYQQIEENNRFFLKSISYQITKRDLLGRKNKKELTRYINLVQKVCNFDGVEIYDANFSRIMQPAGLKVKDADLKAVSADNLQRVSNSQKTLTITGSTPVLGELIRTIGTIPYGANQKHTRGFIVLTVLLSSNPAENIAAVSKGVEQYRQIKLLKKPFRRTYYIALSIVALLVIFCAVWFGIYLAKSITNPIMQIVEGTKKVAAGDLSFSIALKADDEIGSLVDSFNKMTRYLRTSREELKHSAKRLGEQNLETEKRQQYMEVVLKNISAGVISLGSSGLISTINKSAEKMLRISAKEIINKNYKILLNEQSPEFSKNIIEKLADPANDNIVLPLKFTIDGIPKSFIVHINRFKDDSTRHMGVVMVFDDLTELEKAQRIAAWREVARRIAHEVKNPLTPIALSAERLKRKYSKQINEQVFDECTKLIIDHVKLIRNLVNEFSAFAKFPTADLKLCDITPVIKNAVALYEESYIKIDLSLTIVDYIPELNIDKQQIKLAMINLLDNAVAAVKNDGEIKITLSHDPILKLARIEVTDNGPGISDENKTRLFEPNFSTKKSGMGLGLTIVNTIITDHNGMIRVLNNHPAGTKFVIELPIQTH